MNSSTPPTWYPIRDFTLTEAKNFLLKDFSRIIQRTKHLYTETKPREVLGYGFFEPVLLSLCWIDFLGALYYGDGKQKSEGGIGSSERMRLFINQVLGDRINKKYRSATKQLTKVYRNGLVHAYAPAGPFDIRVRDSRNHLKKKAGRIILSVEDLVNDLIQATKVFARDLKLESKSFKSCTLVAFNKARNELG